MTGKHVLLIEDEPNIAEAMRFVLGRDGWNVTSHSDGGSAMDAIRTSLPDVLVLDVMLPGRSGLDILSELRADAALAGMPVLMLSASGQGAVRAEAERAGADRFMTKPFSNAEMLASVRELAGQRH